MPQRGIFVALLALLAVSADAACPARSTPIRVTNRSTEDTTVSTMSNSAVGLYCAGGWKGIPQGELDREAGRSELTSGAGDDNLLLNAMRASNSQAELSNKASEEFADPMFLFWKVGALVMAFMLIIIWWIVCWTACPFCKCCRCFAKERNTPKRVKFVIVIISAALMAGIVIAGLTATDGYGTSVDGFDNMACTSANLLNSTLEGDASRAPAFLGMLPMLDDFATLSSKMDTGSPFLQDIGAVMDSTAPISEAVRIATGSLQLLKDMMQLPANQMPGGAAKHHKCKLCTGLVTPLDDAIAALNNGMGTSLANARNEVESQLTPQKRADLQANIRSSTEPLRMVKNSVRDTFSFFVDTDRFLSVKEMMDGDSPVMLYGLLLIILLAFAISTCGGLSAGCFACRDKASQVEEGKNPYNKLVHRCACVTWCSAWGYCILAFFLGGLFNAIGVPVSSMCLIMDGMSSQMLNDIGPSIGMTFEGDGGVMMIDMIEQCFVPTNSSANANLLEIMFVRENGEKVTMKTKVVDEVKDQIRSQFDAIGGGGTQGNMVANPSVVQLMGMLAGNPVDGMIISDDAYDFQNDPDFQAMWTDSRAEADAAYGAVISSIRCADHNVTGNLPSSGTTMKGVTELGSRMTYFGPLQVNADPCARDSDCSGSGTAAQCTAANNLMQLKRDVRALTTYRCDVFEKPDGSECDPFNMVLDPATGTYTSDCLAPDGTLLPRKEKTCDLQQFTTYVMNFATTIQKTMTRIDDATSSTMEGINVCLRELVDINMVNPIDNIGRHVTCGFLAQYYRELVDGLCFQGIMGFRVITQCYLACAILAFFLMMLQYGIWRRSLDNYNKYGTGYQAAVHVN